MLVRGGATLGPDRTVRRFDGVNEDITERRRAEQRLAEAQRLGQIGSFDRDLEADEVVWSPETYRIFGVDPEHLVPSRENVLALVVAEDRERLRDEVDAAIRDDGAFDCFVTIRRARRRAARAARPRRRARAAGGPRHLIGICQDLTDIRAAERERAELAERFRGVFERAPVGMALVGRDGRFDLVNEALCEFLGRDGPRRACGSRTSPTPTTWRRATTRCGGWPRASSTSGTPRSATCGRTARSAGARCGRCCSATPTAGPRRAWR